MNESANGIVRQIKVRHESLTNEWVPAMNPFMKHDSVLIAGAFVNNAEELGVLQDDLPPSDRHQVRRIDQER